MRRTLDYPGPVPAEGETHIPNKRAKADYKVNPETGCWEWIKSYHTNGYPCSSSYGKPHRVYYQLANGPIPKGEHVHHECRNTKCINPAHLAAPGADAHFKHHFLDENGLSIEDVAEVRRLGAIPGVSARDVAEQFGINNWSVYRYWIGRRWQDDVGSEPVEPEPWSCVECGGPVTGHRHKQYCGKTCKSRAASRRSRQRGYTRPGSAALASDHRPVGE